MANTKGFGGTLQNGKKYRVGVGPYDLDGTLTWWYAIDDGDPRPGYRSKYAAVVAMCTEAGVPAFEVEE